jgi:hypothetical protein
MKTKKLRKKIDKTRRKLAKVTAKLERLEVKQAQKAANNTDHMGIEMPAPVH